MESNPEETPANTSAPDPAPEPSLPARVDGVHLRKAKEARAEVANAQEQIRIWQEALLRAQGKQIAADELIGELYQLADGDKVEADGTIIRKA